MIAASDIVKRLRNGQSMRDLMSKTNPVMMAEAETYVEKEKGKNPVQFELMKNATIQPAPIFIKISAEQIIDDNGRKTVHR